MRAEQRPKRRHHHVWQKYLLQWTINGTLWCRQDDEIFSTGTRVIAVEKDFYKLDKLNHEDVALIKMLFDKGHSRAKRNHAQLLNMLMMPFQIAEQINDPSLRLTIDRYLNDYASNVLEDYHAGIESSFMPSLESALSGDISFYEDDRCIPFLNYLCTQYMRTKGIKERVLQRCAADGSADLSRVWNVLIHMFATNIGADLYLKRKRRKLTLVHNLTSVPFITGDQPAINLKGCTPYPPKSLSIYYPLAPRAALLLADVDEEPLLASKSLTTTQVSVLNAKMFEASYKQVFAQSRESLVDLQAGQ